MLKKMTVENFECFRNTTVFDFKKTNYKLLEKNTHGKILKGALFVGDNAAGKTTALQPIKLLLDMLLKDIEIPLSLFQCLFSGEEVVKLSYIFEIDSCDLEYNFIFDRKSILEERLWVDGKIILERIGNSAKLNLENNAEFHDIDDTLLFAKRVYFNTKFSGNKNVADWFDFMKKSVYVNAYSKYLSPYNNESLNTEKYVEANGVEEINRFFAQNNFKCSIQYAKKIEGRGVRFELSEEDGKMIFFKRDGIDIPIPAFLESTGNQTLIGILPAVLYAVKNGGMLIIDEFSSGLHNKLEELLVKYIMENGQTTQLFFVSHSTNLLSNSLLRPDQIYTVEMAGDAGSVISRFSDEQPRAAQNIEKMYLSGVFGGIPEYGNKKE